MQTHTLLSSTKTSHLHRYTQTPPPIHTGDTPNLPIAIRIYMQISTYANCNTPTRVLTYLKEEVERSWQRDIGCNISLSEERGCCFSGRTISMSHRLIPPELARRERTQTGLCNRWNRFQWEPAGEEAICHEKNLEVIHLSYRKSDLVY